MSRYPRSWSINFFAGLLAIWLVVSTLAILWVDPSAFVLGIALLIFVAILSLTRLLRAWGWVFVALSVAGYAAAQVALVGQTLAALLATAVIAAALVGTGLLGHLAVRGLAILQRQLGNDVRLIEDLRMHDPKTGLVRLNYAQQALKVEVIRSQRYHIELALLLMDLGDRKTIEARLGMVELDEVHAQLANILLAATREVDTCFMNGKLGVILPQTNAEGACIVAERVISSAGRKLSLAIHAGIASFPGDAVSEENLIRAAESALQVAIDSGRPIVLSHQVRGALDQADQPAETESGSEALSAAGA